MPEKIKAPRDIRVFGYALFVLGVAILSLMGYIGYVAYPRFDLPAVTGASLFVLAAAAGIASFFSPCSFPLLLTLLAREVRNDGSPGQSLLWKAFCFASALSLGASLLLLGAGLVVAAGGAVLFSSVTFASPAGRLIRTVVGVSLIGLGLVQRGVFQVSLDRVYQLSSPILKVQTKIRRQHPGVSFVVFGVGYLLAGFG